MEYKVFKDIKLSRLGMGNMRLPNVEFGNPNSPIDHKKAYEIIEAAYLSGINYFDTAYVYNGGDSEICVGEWVKKHDRSTFYIATKWHLAANADYKGVFEEQLKRLQTDYIDFYLIHCLTDGNVDDYLKSGGIEFFLEMKRQGKIKYLGFSSHAGVAALEKFADHHQWDFAQLQINYYDWIFSDTAKEYQILKERNVPIMVMEPVRGGKLAKLNDEAEALLRSKHSDWSDASWAFRFVKSLEQTQVILSGMNTLEQMQDNVATFSDDYQFTKDDEETLFEAAKLFKKNLVVPCTACRYCTHDCPMGINIPEFFKFYNAYKLNGAWGLEGVEKVDSTSLPEACLHCNTCVPLCPQKIDIPAKLAELAAVMEK